MDILSISRGITRYSSQNWEVRAFLAAPGASLRRDMAPELLHAGLYLPFGSSTRTPELICRHMPLFGSKSVIPPDAGSGSIFLTASHDDLEEADLLQIRRILFEGGDLCADPRLTASVDLFESVMSDAFHIQKDLKRTA